ncbi:MAG: ExbD/TolR family protein [Roseateles asaccharophilus]|jgi:biopolymer transport protein ExbD|uniref:Outer membrane transport energization protein ExbD n=1 Tax=Roseateles asaccharophilus TaxID=582607 RepID=A0A4V3CJ37_9BURK|nr:biopolymer transporter ExbD [Roseateles asaccharophilus]MDN3545567.1 biopolymer transporter ExbD [Roseateles asaccharophilus]TDP07948.1 outer membrane transport energization protein ExbD [Roseateles asaccharophilus]
MGMNVGSSSGGDEPEVMMDVNTTPLIDVMLVLLVMLIITIPIQLHSVNLDLPAGNPPPPTREPVVHEVFIDFDGTVSWDGVALPNHAAVEAKLNEVAAAEDQPEVHIKPNKLVDYGAVAAVMASAQRLGVKKMGMIGNEQFIN